MKNVFGVFAVLFAVMLLGSCKQKNKRMGRLANETGYPVFIDVREDYPKKEIFMQDFASVSYVPLQTDDEMLVTLRDNSNCRPVVTDDGVFLRTGGKAFLFDYSGRFKSALGAQGRGPNEYLEIGDICADEEKKDLYIKDDRGSEIFVYDYDGEFKRKFPAPRGSNGGMGYCGDGSLIIPTTSLVDSAYAIISSVDGKRIRDVGQRYARPLAVLILNYRNLKALYRSDKLRSCGDEFIMKDISTDTITALNRLSGDVYPKFVKLPSNLDREEPERSYIDYGFEIPRYAFLFVVDYNYNMTGYIVDKSTGDVFRGTPKNRDIADANLNTMRFYQGTGDKLVYFFEAVDLITMYEKGQLSGELEKIAAGLDEDANPVMMVMQLK